MPKAVFSYSFIQLYYLPYIRLKPELPESRGEQSFTLYKAKARAPREQRRAEPRIASFTYCLPSFRLLEPLALTFILRALHNKAFY